MYILNTMKRSFRFTIWKKKGKRIKLVTHIVDWKRKIEGWKDNSFYISVLVEMIFKRRNMWIIISLEWPFWPLFYLLAARIHRWKNLVPLSKFLHFLYRIGTSQSGRWTTNLLPIGVYGSPAPSSKRVGGESSSTVQRFLSKILTTLMAA